MFSSQIPEEIILKFGQSKSLCVLTGAGISLPCGIPSFSGNGRIGHFQNYTSEYLSSLSAWKDYPELVKDFYNTYRNYAHKARPGIAHQTIHGWEQRRFAYPLKFSLMTLNFDGLHHLMGNDPIIELQGTIWQLRCEFCQTIFDLVPFRQLPMPENCDICQGELRPNILFNDETVSRLTHRQAVSAIEQSDMFISIGVSGRHSYVDQLVKLARRKCGYLIEINPQTTIISQYFDVNILLPAEEALPQFYWDYLAEETNFFWL
jgi:NAD-dependent deacetylase